MVVPSLPQALSPLGGSQAGPDRKPLLRASWKLETGSEEMPEYLIGLGDTAEQSFSLRVALDKMQDMIACEQYRQHDLAVA